MPKQIVTSKDAPTTGFTDLQKPPPIAQAIRFGNMLFVSGQGPLDPSTRTVVKGDIEVQTRRTLDNLLSVLAAGSATLANVVNVRVVLRHVEDFSRFNEVFRSYFENDRVTRTCIGGTPHRKGVNVEIDCVAMFD
jgi:2-iminobutanoate/2-iminopropanoate deaminase